MIVLGNLLALAILACGALVLSETREQLIQARIDALAVQGELLTDVLADTATVGEPEPALLEARARQVLQRLTPPRDTRIRLFARDGRLVADSIDLADKVLERRLPELRPRDRDGEAAPGAGWRAVPFQSRYTFEQERTLAIETGEAIPNQRLNERGQRVLSVSMPLAPVQYGVGVLTIEAEDVDDIIARERLAMLPFLGASAGLIVAASLLLALVIARPLRRLADAADGLRRTGATRLVLPDVARRHDEIGDLAKALERMTASLAERIDANERFAADVSHELKNPLTSIRSAVETTRSSKDAEARDRLLAIIAADVGRLDRLITDISRASRLEAETARGASSRVDLGRLLSQIVETYAHTRREGEATVMFRGPAPPDAVVLGQDGPLGQVFRNLIDNARSFSPLGGVVTVGVETERRKEGRLVRVIVADQGPGVPPDSLETIFERFYTDRPKGAAFGGNSGLGLSIARQIVEAHKGRIWAENIAGLAEGDRLGARFIVQLPGA